MATRDPATLSELLEFVARSRSSRTLAAAIRGEALAPQTVGGCHGSLLALHLAAYGSSSGLPPILVLVPLDDDARDLGLDLQALGVPPAAIFESGDENALARARSVASLRGSGQGILVASVAATLEGYPAAATLGGTRLVLRTGSGDGPEALASVLFGAGFKRAELVTERGTVAVRGDLIDIYDHAARQPLRVEFVNDRVDNLRRFDSATQLSTGRTDSAEVELLLPGRAGGDVPLVDHLDSSLVVMARDPLRLEQASAVHLARVPESERAAVRQRGEALRSRREIVVTKVRETGDSGLNLGSTVVTSEGMTLQAAVRTLERVSRGKSATLLAFDDSAERERFFEALRGEGAPDGAAEVLRRPIIALDCPLSGGFSAAALGVAVIAHHELFASAPPARVTEAEQDAPVSRALESFLDLSEGDYVVHLIHGIARFARLERLERGGSVQDFLVLEFDGGLNVYVPAAKIDLVQRYIGGRGDAPELSRVGSGSWQKRKEKVAAAVTDLAVELLELNAIRARAEGVAHPPDTPWQATFEASFPFKETPDQLTALAAIKADLEARKPMDRLVCGDVGFGKTELAMRAAFKCVMGGRQVAVLVPTTVLADQHWQTFRARMADFPVTIDCLSRFRSTREQKEVAAACSEGAVDILIGTHRLLQKDVAFKDLGLLIVDEEQRFGVAHKERLRLLRRNVDVISLSATPIPRTLSQAVMGIRDISTLTQAPGGRRRVISEVVAFERGLVRAAVLRELDRGGQVFFVHNRVQTIQKVAHELKSLIPEASFLVGHGQMGERELERTMAAFTGREAQVLVATTIIESGLDIPNANTIFVDHANHYGLADLHQLRGRVGRSHHQAYAYFLLRPDGIPTEIAERRLHAIEEFSDLGAGFHLAMRDLEIRGAGNILGAEQSGHIASVGYELYCRLLEMAVKRLRQERIISPDELELFLDFDAFLPENWISDRRQRIDAYRRLGRCRDERDFRTVVSGLVDRFGTAPDVVLEFVDVARIRAFMEAARITRLEIMKGEGPLIASRSPGGLRRRVRLSESSVRVLRNGSLLLVHPAPFQGPRELLAFLESAVGTERDGAGPEGSL